MNNVFVVFQAFIAIFSSCLAQQELMADTSLSEQDILTARLEGAIQERDDMLPVYRIDLGHGKLDNVDVGHIIFGVKETRRLLLINLPEKLDIVKPTFEGCSSCSDVQIGQFSKIDGESKAYQCDLIFNKKKVFPSDTMHKKLIHLRGSDGYLRYKFNICYRIVPTRMTDPNSLSFEKAIPEKLYSVVLRKKSDFTVVSVQIAHKQLKLTKWQDQENKLLLSFKPLHTLEDIKIDSWIKIVTLRDGTLYVPLVLVVREHIFVEPKQVILGLIRPGETKEKCVRIQCDSEFAIERVGDSENDIHFELVKASPKCKEFRLSFENRAEEKGVFKKEIMFRVLPYNEIISLPVYGVIVK